MLKYIVAGCALLTASAATVLAGDTQAIPKLTRDEALNDPLPVLARKAAGQLAPLLWQVERPTYVSPLGGDSLTFLRFATEPRAVEPGLCESTVITIEFDAVHLAKADAQGTATSVSMATVYKAAADLNPNQTWNAIYESRLLQSCRANRVIPTESSSLGQHVYFTLTDDPPSSSEAWLAARALQEAMDSAADPNGPIVTCASEDAKSKECANPAALLHSLSLDALVKAQARPCPSGKDTELYCVTGEFTKGVDGNCLFSWRVDLTVRAPRTGDTSREVVAVGPVTVTSQTMVFD
jgi:hypothetical protein